MSRPDWLRTFVAIYRAGSVSDGARRRALSQPAASQQLAALERAVGGRLFVRAPGGVVPTARGRALYGEVASALDHLELVLSGLDRGRAAPAGEPLRIGTTAECFAAEILPRLPASGLDVVAWFGDDADTVERLQRGEVDVAVTSRGPLRKSVEVVPAGQQRFVLVGPPDSTPPPRFRSLGAVGSWLAGRDWAAYSLELPLTRRFWQAQLGRPFSGRLRLVAPDLRVVADAVARGIGCSLLPSFVCTDLLAAGRMVEIHPVADLVPPQPWYCCVRQGEAGRPAIAALLASFTPLPAG